MLSPTYAGRATRFFALGALCAVLASPATAVADECAGKQDYSVCDSDGNGCTPDYCFGGACQHPVCPNVGACTAGTCVNNACVYASCETQCQQAGACNYALGTCAQRRDKPDNTPCDADPNQCTADVCKSGVCTKGGAVACEARPPCISAAVCNKVTNTCHLTIASTDIACEDGDGCTVGDRCDGKGACASGGPRQCKTPPTDAQCHEATGSCLSGACTYEVLPGIGCNDGDLCTLDDKCTASGICTGQRKQCNSPPQTQCYSAVGVCEGGTCSYTQLLAGASCDDGDVCTTGDECDAAAACAGSYQRDADAQCKLSPSGSVFTANPALLAADGRAASHLIAKPMNQAGRPYVTENVELSCSFGQATPVVAAGGSWTMDLRSSSPGISACVAKADGEPFGTALEVAFVGLGLTLEHAPEGPYAEPGGTAKLFVKIGSGDAQQRVPGIRLALTLPPEATFVEGSAEHPGGTLDSTVTEGGVAIVTLPLVPEPPALLAVNYQIRLSPEAWGEMQVKAQAKVGDTPASEMMAAKLIVGSQFELGGCGCSSAGLPGAGALALLMGLWALRRRGARP